MNRYYQIKLTGILDGYGTIIEKYSTAIYTSDEEAFDSIELFRQHCLYPKDDITDAVNEIIDVDIIELNLYIKEK